MNYVVLDLETTWLDPKKDKIIEIAIVKFDEETYEIIETYTSFINPLIPIPDINSNITGITDSDVVGAPTFAEEKKKIESIIWDCPIVGHNVFFDVNFLLENGVNIRNNAIVDTFFLSNFLHFLHDSLSLESLCNFYSISLVGAHRALNDTLATLSLFKELIQTFHALDIKKKQLLQYVFSLSSDKNILFLKSKLFSHIEEKLDDSLFIKNILDILDKKTILNHDINEKTANLKQKYEDIVENLPWFYFRENQKKLMNEVFEWFKTSHKKVIEAPTWIGKTVAYLIPSIFHSITTWEKVYISTKTKALQDQIYFKDLALLQKSLWCNFYYMKLKGKSNYFSVSSFMKFVFFEEMNYDRVLFVSKILVWLFDTKYGELDDINYYWVEYSFLRYINAEHTNIMAESNIYKKYEFYVKIKKAQTEANIIVINHNILFSDIDSNGEISKNMENIIIDEAHSLEDIGTESLKKKYNRNTFFQVMESVKKEYVKKNISESKLNNQLEALDLDFEFIESQTLKNLSMKYDIRNTMINLLIKDVSFYTDIFQNTAVSICRKIDFLIEELEETDGDFFSQKKYLTDVKEIFSRIFTQSSHSEYIPIVTWNERNGISFEFTFLNIWNYLKENIWEKVKNVFLLSATLKVGDDFSYIESSLWLSAEDFWFSTYESDFDYKNQARLYIPNDLWSIKNNFSSISLFLQDTIEIIKGRGMVLFTSFWSIKNFYIGANMYLKKQWITLLSQSIFWSKFKILNIFQKKADTSIIVGTDSFWEWVDIAWDDLQFLFIHKFPFSVPTDPVFEARSKLYKEAFSEYSIPKSIIKMKQWFWRLIRTKKDIGIVFLLDDRIFSTAWWKEFFKAFPKDIDVYIWSKKTIQEKVKNFIYS